jgi:hypothetical protein
MNKGFLRRGLWIMPFLAALVIVMSASVTHAVPVCGITTTNQLVRFDSATPSAINIPVAITASNTSRLYCTRTSMEGTRTHTRTCTTTPRLRRTHTRITALSWARVRS